MGSAAMPGATDGHHLISADKVEGTTVKNAAGDKLGSIKNVMIDKDSGHVAYAVMSFGGFLGIGERYHALPWGVLKYDQKEDAYLVNLDKETLKNAPTHSAGDHLNWDDQIWGQKVHDYYHVPPYWL